jgi:hypothetical protein
MTQPAINIKVDGATVLRVDHDGDIEWSEDQVNGGPPMHHARVDADEVKRVVSEVRDAVGGEWIGETFTGPDSRSTSIVVHDGSKEIVNAESWHELFESDPRVVATSTGVQPLGDRSRDAVLKDDKDDYREFRRRWEIVTRKLRGLIPSDNS